MATVWTEIAAPGTAIVAYPIGANVVDANAYASLNAMVTAIGVNQRIAVISGALSVVADLTVPTNIALVTQYPGHLTWSAGILTINGQLEAAGYKIFDGFGANQVVFGVGSVKYVDPRWFGDLNTTITVIGSGSAYIRINDVQTLTANLTVPANCDVEVTRVGRLAKAAAYVPTFNGSFKAGPYQVFSGFDSGDITFSRIEKVYPQWWGADSSGSIESSSEIQKAIDTLFPVNLEGTWKVGTSLIIRGGWVDLSADGVGIIYPTTDTFPVFVNNPTAAITNFKLKNLYINYGIATGNVPSVNANACAFKFTGATYFPYYYKLENIRVFYAYAGYYDTSLSYMATLENVNTEHCTNGFWKETGTTFRFVNCYPNYTTAKAWYTNGLSESVFESSGFDNCTAGSATYAYFKSSRGIVFNGFGFESNTVSGTGNSLVLFEGCQVTINGFYAYNNVLSTAAADVVSMVKFTAGSWASMSGAFLVLTSNSYTGTGTAINIWENEAVGGILTIQSSFITKLSGATGTSYSLSDNGSAVSTQITCINTALADYSLTLGSLSRIEGADIYFGLSGSATWNPGNLVDGAGETSASMTVTGAALGDFVLCSAPYDLQGITCNAYVDAANSVKIRLQNETGGAIDLASGTWKVRVLKQ